MPRNLLPYNPLGALVRIDTTPKRVSRRLTPEEIGALLETAPPLRALWYETAMATGYRIAELESIRIADLDRAGPSLVVRAEHTKNRRPARQFIPLDLCDRLVALAAGRPSDAPLLGIPTSKKWTVLKRDCRAAGVALLTPAGRVGWHSFRRCLSDAMLTGGADLRTIMDVMRHSTASLSVGAYGTAHEGRRKAAALAAAERLPGVGGAPVVLGPESPGMVQPRASRSTASSDAAPPCGT